MSTVIIRLLIIMFVAVCLTQALAIGGMLAAAVRARWQSRHDHRCACRALLLGDVRSWTDAGVRHEKHRCQPTREVIR